MPPQKTYIFYHKLTHCINVIVKAYSEHEARTMLNSYVRDSSMFYLKQEDYDGCKFK